MLKKLLAVLAMFYAAASFAAVEVNTAKASELDALSGIGPVTSKRILDERKKGKFKSWEDLLSRVKGIKENTATKLSAQGLTVDGQEFKVVAKKADEKAARKDDKAAKKEEKKDDKAAAAKPAASAKK